MMDYQFENITFRKANRCILRNKFLYQWPSLGNYFL